MDKPLYEHDCKSCIFLGTFDPPVETAADLYVCERNESSCIPLARFSSSPSDYVSGMEQVAFNIWIREAVRRAIEKGLVDPDKVLVNSRGGPRSMVPLALELRYSQATDILDGSIMLPGTVEVVRSIEYEICPFCKSLEGERLCFDLDQRYNCTRPFKHNGEHVACAGAACHMVAYWAPKEGFAKLCHTEANMRK